MIILGNGLFGAPQIPFAQSQYAETTNLPDVCKFNPHLLKEKAFRTTFSESMCEKSDLCDRSTDLIFIAITVNE
jgi:hypothetical protein